MEDMTDEEKAEAKKAFEKWMKENAHKYKTEEELSKALKREGFRWGVYYWEKKNKKKRRTDD